MESSLDELNTSEWPWAQHSFVLGNLAIGNIRENLKRQLTLDGRIHAETLLTSIGALAGFAAQHAALVKAEAATRDFGSVGTDGIVLLKVRSGQEYLIGPWINWHLLPERKTNQTLFGLVAVASVQSGLQEQDLPDIREIATHFTRAAGTPEFDVIRVPEGTKPHLSPVTAAKLLWPLVTNILRLPAPTNMAENEDPLNEKHWPLILAAVAGQFVTQTKDVIRPKLSSNLIMEAAWIASKTHPDAINPNTWRIVADAGRLKVTRTSAVT